ncbi:alkaline phosphatase [Actinorhabdospora filicis]|uniref:Alkaline phosphatase n=1 Tax=Actinorhabdospora filicis TaxID=1785913 RepID=A0A9W6WDG1_9ACTN|nr:alkaline phosphatase D family protein [Actinorhabdospora filicis]GLZ81576.1 alkaline phosphatase [Actinorhabdospora filicis]
MPDLVLGPLLRHVDAVSATVWVETDAPCDVAVAGRVSPTFTVAGHHYALVVLDGLEPGSVTSYDVRLDGVTRWPREGADAPSVRTLGRQDELHLVFGSCRMPESRDPAESASWGTDALAAYAARLTGGGERPDLLVLLGDQVYADETSKATGEWIAARRDVSVPPGKEVAGYAEYARLYHESWATPAIRYLLSTVPTAMIFDDHDVRDDWNTSLAWREAIEATAWWAEREEAALVSYWVYQHLGNLSPAELAADDTVKAVMHAGRDGGDAHGVLREFARAAIREADGAKGTRWSYRRDLGRTRLIMTDTRSGRILREGRAMVGDGEFAWLEANAEGDVDHLLIGSSLPWLLPHVIDRVQAMNEAACRRPGWRGRFAERLRQAADLEHWAAFRASSERLARLIRGAAERGAATVSVLSGDVHHGYVAEAFFDRPVGARVFQLVCSPLHNRVPRWLRPFFRAGWWHPLAAALWRWRSSVRWRRLAGPYFGNMVATLRISGRRAEVTVELAGSGPVLRPLPAVSMSAPPPP